MEESVTYQAIVRKWKRVGMLYGERTALLLQGTERFGPPSVAVRAAVEAVDDPARLEALIVRAMKVDSWQELLAEPKAARARRRK